MISKIKKKYNQLPSFVKNRYFIGCVAFAIWMLFIDANNAIYHFRIKQEISELETKRIFYKEGIAQVQQEKEDLFSSSANIEKYARENYWMKKENEDIFILVSE